MSRKKRNTPFQPGHGILYGLRTVARDPHSNAVTSVACRFCEKFGREEKPGAKRRATQRVKHFKQPFRTENYHQHHSGQHRTRWTEYKLLPPERKVAYLASPGDIQGHDAYSHIANVVNEPTPTPTPSSAPPVPTSAHPNSDPIPPQQSVVRIAPIATQLRQALKFMVDTTIIETVIGDMFVDTIHENTTKERAIATFTAPTHPVIKDYCVKITNTHLFDAALAFLSQGATPRVATAMIAGMLKATSPTNEEARALAECSEGKVSAYIRCVIAFNLQALTDMLRLTWTFGLSFAKAEHGNVSFIDISIRFHLYDDIHTFHLLSCPLPDRFNTEAIYKSLCNVLDALHGMWRHYIIGVSTDGSDIAEMAAIDIAERIRPDCPSILLHSWSAAHQLDLLVKSAMRSVLDESYYDTLGNLVAFLRRQDAFLLELSSQCPKLSTSSWLSLSSTLEWIKLHRIRILQYLEEKKPGFGPNMTWWILSMGVLEFTRAVAKTYRRIHGFTTVISRQVALLSELMRTLQRLSGCKGPITQDELNLLSQWDIIVEGKYVVQKAVVRNFLSGLGSFVHISTNELPHSTLDGVVHAVGTLFLSAIVGISSIIESRREPSAGGDDIPPVLPNELIKLSRISFNGVVRVHAHRLATKFTPADIEQIEGEFGEFLEAYHREETFNSAIHTVTHHSSFESSWGVLRGRFGSLHEFCGGIGAAYPAKFSSGLEFGILRDNTEMFRICGITDFPLEGSLHCKQFKRLQALLKVTQAGEGLSAMSLYA